MTNYVLMPEEATLEMELAAEKYWNDRKFKALSDDPRTWKGLYAAMRAVAPAVQGEPVAWQFFQDGKWHMGGYTKNHRENTVAAGFPVRDLYAEQQPAPDVSGLVEALEAVVFFHMEVKPNDVNLMMYYSKMLSKVRGALAAHRKGGGK